MAGILSYICVFIHGYAPFFIYFMYFGIGYLIIGIPCSIISDMIIFRMKGTIFCMIMGFTLHLIFAGIVVYLISLAESDGFLFKYASVLVYSVFVAATGLWLFDSILKKIQFPR
jgi:hypothetical protein